MSNELPNLFTIKQFAKEHRAFTEGGLRDNIFCMETNGLAEYGAIIRNGRRVLIDEKKFFAWVVRGNK